jgi:hypothetical protein
LILNGLHLNFGDAGGLKNVELVIWDLEEKKALIVTLLFLLF